MGHVCEVSPFGSYLFGEGYCVCHQLMRVMLLFKAQGVDNESANALQIGHLRGGDGLHVGDVGKGADAEAEDGHFAVHHFYWRYLYVADAEGVVFADGVEFEWRRAGVEVLAETIGHNVVDALPRGLVGIESDVAENGKGAQVVDASDVVVMQMGEEYAVNGSEGERHELLTDVGSAVDEQSCCHRLYQGSAAKALVVRVSAATHFAGAAQRGNASRCACAQEGDA
jgi:hypothetical protein